MALTDQQLALKKRLLLHRSAVLRAELGQQAHRTMAPVLGMADRVRHGGQWLSQHPWWLVGAAAALIVARPRNVMNWASRGLWLWQTWQRVAPLLQSSADKKPASGKLP